MSLFVHSILKSAALTAIFLLCAAGMSAAAAEPIEVQWEQTTAPDKSEVFVGDDNNETTDIEIRDGAVYITVQRPVKVEVVSILGQLIASRTIPAGTTRLTLRHRGVYILKTGSQARRITI